MNSLLPRNEEGKGVVHDLKYCGLLVEQPQVLVGLRAMPLKGFRQSRYASTKLRIVDLSPGLCYYSVSRQL